MNRILVDTSVWIDYFKSCKRFSVLSDLIRDNQVCTNELILSELIPILKLRGQKEVIEALHALPKVPLHIDWNFIRKFQFKNLKNGINKVGIPDLIILQNVMDENLVLFTKDKHFVLMQELFNFRLFDHCS